MLLYLGNEGPKQLYSDIISAVVIITIAREVALDLIIGHETILITDRLHLRILDGGKGVNDVGEAGDTGCKRATDIGINERHLGCLIVVLVMHVLDEVKDIHIDACKPVHHGVILCDHFIIVKILGCDWTVRRANLLLCLLIHTAVDRIKEAFGEVCTSTEELHLLTGLRCRYAAADGVIIAPYRTHHVIIFILDGGGLYRDLCRILLEVLRQSLRVKDRKVRLRSRAHVLERVEETEVVLCNHRTAILTHAGYLEGCPNRIAGEKLVVGRNTCELDHTKLHDEMIDELLRL